MDLASAASTWGGETAGVIAAVVFIGFATWIVLQRLRHGRDRHDDD